MEWEIGQLPTDPLLYSFYGADHYCCLELELELEEEEKEAHFQSSSPSDWHHVVLPDHHTTSSSAASDLMSCTIPLIDHDHDHDHKSTVIQPPTSARNWKSSKSKVEGVELEDLQKYFNRPIVEAAAELGVGLTLLKKRCRHLGISRWPHRKIKSITTLIHNLNHLGQSNWEPMLQKHRRMVEAHPNMELTPQARKIRQKCFKALYYTNTKTRTRTRTRTNRKRNRNTSLPLPLHY